MNGRAEGVVQAQEQVAGARAQLVTGYAEHRASLCEKKQYRRAIKIDLKLPEASTALAGVPRRKAFADGDEGRKSGRPLSFKFGVYIRGSPPVPSDVAV